MKLTILSVFAAFALATASFFATAGDALQPFVMGSSGAGDLAGKVGEAKGALEGAGFEVVGDYSPYVGAHVIVVTNAALKKAAGGSEHGGFGSVMRVGVTDVEGQIQVSYTNPAYWAAAYRMSSDLGPVSADLSKALGAGDAFGYPKGFSADDLKRYHYMAFMPYFDDQEDVGDFGSQAAAVSKMESNLKAGKGGTALVYRLDLANATLFGVEMKEGAGADATVMSKIDTGKMRHTAHLPYEVLVEDGKAYILHGKFRIAVSFPELTMGSFMSISDVPGAITDTMEAAAK